MKTIQKIVIVAATLLFVSCAKDYVPKNITVPAIEPKVQKVEIQAKAATTQSRQTVELAKVVEKKYQTDKDVAAVVESARLTTVEAQKTEFELEFLRAAAKNVDIKAMELTVEAEKKDQALVEQKRELTDVKTTVIKQQAKISSRNSYLIGAGLVILALGSIIIKPWRWFI